MHKIEYRVKRGKSETEVNQTNFFVARFLHRDRFFKLRYPCFLQAQLMKLLMLLTKLCQ